MVCRTARTCTICLNALFILIGISLASTGAYMLHVLGKYDIPGAVSLYFYNNNFYSIYKNIVLTFAIVPNCIQLFSISHPSPPMCHRGINLFFDPINQTIENLIKKKQFPPPSQN